MRRICILLWHVQTTLPQSKTRLKSPGDGRQDHRSRRIPRGPGHSPAGHRPHDPGADRRAVGGRTRHCRPLTATAARGGTALATPAPKMGRTPARRINFPGRAGVPGPRGAAGRSGGGVGGFATARGLGREVGPQGGGLGGVSAFGSPWLAQAFPRYPTPQERPDGASRVEKNSPRCWRICSPPKQSPGGASA